MDSQKIGDVIIFEAADDWVGKGIAILTKSNVSHSAMVYSLDPSENGINKMVEMGPTGIQVNRFENDKIISEDDIANTGKAWFLRKKPLVDAEVLISSIDKYLESGVKYDYPSLVFLAGLLIFNGVQFDEKIKRAANTLLKLATIKLNARINSKIHGDDTITMMCSQLVYQCHLDSGPDNWIELNDPLLRIPLEHEIRLSDYVSLEKLPEIKNIEFEAEVTPEQEAETIKELVKLLLATEDETAVPEDVLSSDGLADTLELAADFLARVNIVRDSMVKEGHLKTTVPMHAMFVTPVDLFHASNLISYEEAQVTRTFL